MCSFKLKMHHNQFLAWASSRTQWVRLQHTTNLLVGCAGDTPPYDPPPSTSRSRCLHSSVPRLWAQFKFLAMPLAKWTFPSKNTTQSMLTGALPQTPLGELTALPRSIDGFKGAALQGRGLRERLRTQEGGKGIKG